MWMRTTCPIGSPTTTTPTRASWMAGITGVARSAGRRVTTATTTTTTLSMSRSHCLNELCTPQHYSQAHPTHFTPESLNSVATSGPQHHRPECPQRPNILPVWLVSGGKGGKGNNGNKVIYVLRPCLNELCAPPCYPQCPPHTLRAREPQQHGHKWAPTLPAQVPSEARQLNPLCVRRQTNQRNCGVVISAKRWGTESE